MNREISFREQNQFLYQTVTGLLLHWNWAFHYGGLGGLIHFGASLKWIFDYIIIFDIWIFRYYVGSYLLILTNNGPKMQSKCPALVTYCSGVSPVWVLLWTSRWFLRLNDFPHVSQMKSLTPVRTFSYMLTVYGVDILTWQVFLCEFTWVDDHVSMQVIRQVKLFPAAWMRTDLCPPFPVD